MGFRKAFPILLALAGTLLATPGMAQSISDDSAVWAVIERAWAAEQRGETKWVDELLAPDFVGWPKDSPAPRDRRSTRLWMEYSTKQSEMLEHELYPLSIVVHGDVAIAHYLYSAASRLKGAPIERHDGRFTDVLVRVDGQWKFLSWHGGDH
ncbi:MAG: nuclear transport factor 2 family protein [Gammaproteobacteria bacterium]|nr:nuclear transport factor 2 family protein [Gammaproteobacteria bacterium]MDH4255579.1 nuclear transport factor 2 family protein [Gammaproteobacteria bacterium]MDH5311570.1 nuclear transport factor 2 family protein [Gammaproteobacteria bacterium]